MNPNPGASSLTFPPPVPSNCFASLAEKPCFPSTSKILYHTGSPSENSIEALETTNKPEIDITLKKTDKKLILTFFDNGPGYDGDIDDLIKPYFSTKNSSGLGLSLIKEHKRFVTEYSMSTPSEDMAEVFSFIITNKEKIEDKAKIDPILNKKILFIKKNILKIDETFNFN